MNLDQLSKIFATDLASVLEMILRGTVVYLTLLLLLRFFRREGGALNTPDLLFVVIIADAAQNAIAGDYQTITEGLVLVATILFWNYALDWAGYRFPLIKRLVHAPPLALVKDGRLVPHNLRREMISAEELRAQLRSQGIEDVKEVKQACLEADGQISVIRKDSGDDHRQKPKKSSVG